MSRHYSVLETNLMDELLLRLQIPVLGLELFILLPHDLFFRRLRGTNGTRDKAERVVSLTKQGGEWRTVVGKCTQNEK